MRTSKAILVTLLLLVVVVNIVYWQDPWLWRRYVGTFLQLAGSQPSLLEPNEFVPGDGSFVIPFARPELRTIEPDALRSVEEYAAKFDSYALIVTHKGTIQSEWYADGRGAHDLTQSQSMHKTLMGLLIGIAIEKNLIDSIDDPVSRYLPDWQGDPRGDITLYQLMTMSSGLAQYEFRLNPFTDDFRWLYSGDTVPVVLRTPQADWSPGEKFDYNNINSELLGLVLENVFEQRYADILQQNLWVPMGGAPALVWLDHEGGNAYTSCCLMATPRDWIRIGLMMLNRGQINGHRIVGADWTARMIERSRTSAWYGLQIWLGFEEAMDPLTTEMGENSSHFRTEPFLTRDTYFFSGRGGQRVYIVPSLELVIVRLGPALGPQPIKPGWDNSFIVNTVIRNIRL